MMNSGHCADRRSSLMTWGKLLIWKVWNEWVKEEMLWRGRTMNWTDGMEPLDQLPAVGKSSSLIIVISDDKESTDTEREHPSIHPSNPQASLVFLWWSHPGQWWLLSFGICSRRVNILFTSACSTCYFDNLKKSEVVDEHCQSNLTNILGDSMEVALISPGSIDRWWPVDRLRRHSPITTTTTTRQVPLSGALLVFCGGRCGDSKECQFATFYLNDDDDGDSRHTIGRVIEHDRY